MKCIRIIPKLEVKGENLIKGVHLEGLRVVGKPEEMAFKYYQDGADELIYIDLVASLYQRNSFLDLVERTAKKAFIPLTVGGGIRSVKDVRMALRAGGDKVAINTAAISRPEIISQVASIFGSQCMVVSMEVQKKNNGIYECYTDCGRTPTGIDPFSWAQKVIKLGAGEILLTSINQDGTMLGFDLDLVRLVATRVPIPVIACGGAGAPEHVKQVIIDGKADAVCVSSMFHFGKSSISKLKKYLKSQYISVREI